MTDARLQRWDAGLRKSEARRFKNILDLCRNFKKYRFDMLASDGFDLRKRYNDCGQRILLRLTDKGRDFFIGVKRSKNAPLNMGSSGCGDGEALGIDDHEGFMLVYDIESIEQPKGPIASHVWLERLHEGDGPSTKLAAFYSLVSGSFKIRPVVTNNEIGVLPILSRRDGAGDMIESRTEVIERITRQYKNILSDFPEGGKLVLGAIGRLRIGISKVGIDLLWDSPDSLTNDGFYISDVLIGPLNL